MRADMCVDMCGRISIGAGDTVAKVQTKIEQRLGITKKNQRLYTDGRAGGRTDGRTDGQTDRRTDIQTDGRTHARTHARMHTCTPLRARTYSEGWQVDSVGTDRR